MPDDLTIRDKVAILGIGQTEFTRAGAIARSEFQLACEAILAAVDDAGIDISDVDGICSYADDRNEAPHLAAALGIPHIGYSNMVWSGGGGGSSASIGNACAALLAGYANYVVVFRALAQGQFGRYGQGLAARVERVHGHVAYQMPFGMTSNAQSQAAMQAQRHIHEFGTKPEHFGAVALAANRHAQRNPNAVMYGRPLDMKTYLASRWIARPLRLFDCCLESDGAAAAVLTTVDRAPDTRHRPARVMAVAQGHGDRYYTGAHNRPQYLTTNHNAIAPRLWHMAGIGPGDIDVAQFHDNFTPLVLMQFEDYGFCAKGEGGPFTEGGRLDWPDGNLPINTSGGNLSEAFIHGFQLITEAVRQIWGTSTCQVDGAETSFVASAPGSTTVSSLILRR